MTQLFPSRVLVEGNAARRLFVVFAVASVLCASLCAQDSSHSQTPPSAAQVAASGAIDLDPGKPLERTLTGAETHRYRLKLQTGECGVIHVEQRGIDVAVQLVGNDNHLVAEADDEISKNGTETLRVVADHDGSYTLQVKPKLPLGPRGAYEIRLVEVRPATSLDRTMYEVRQLRTTVSHFLEANQPLQALPAAQRALALAQAAPGVDEVDIALLTRDLAEANYASGKFEEAQSEFERALHTLTAKLGAENPQTIDVESRIGYLHAYLEEPSQADHFLNQALERAERVLGPDDPMVAATLAGLSMLSRQRGDFAKATRDIQRALAILERAGLTEQSTYGALLSGQGLVYMDMGDSDKAQAYLERNLQWVEQHYGLSPALSKVLNNLGIVARRKKDYPAAEKYYLRALDLKEKFVGAGHSEYAAVLMNLANVYASEGDYKKALEAHLRSLHIYEKNAAPGESAPIFSLANVAKDYAALGDFENANQVQSRLELAVEEDIALNLAVGSDREKLLYLDSMAQRAERAISLNLQLEPGSTQAAATAATVLLQRKGRALDATADLLGALRKHSEPQDQAMLDQLKDATTQLAHLALRGPQKQTSDEYGKALQELQEKKEKLENAISHHNEEFRAESQAVTLGAVSSAVPEDAALVEFVTYRPFNPKAQTDAEQFGELRYAAYVLHHGGAARGVDLGSAQAIDAAVKELREALRDPGRSDVQQRARALAARVFLPLQPLLAGDKHLLISPDGQLALIPFEALLDDQGRYLLERFPITYLTSGRDLLHMQVPRSSQSAPVIVADPFFGEPEGSQIASAARPRLSPRTARRSVTTGTDFSSLYFAPLSGTRTEAKSIGALFPEARVLLGKEASEATLEQLHAPKILHIATHGFFLQNGGQAKNLAGGRSATATASDNPESPLLRSGLALSGANLVKDGKGSGILTALEATNLDLWGTKLVTLSACDTGVGEIKNGEGVYGLRRSFVLAGAETLVMSLWPVSDYVTREMMTAYYKGLKQGLGRGEALRQAELAMLKRKDRRHPFYWASFIQSGEWANLDGQR